MDFLINWRDAYVDPMPNAPAPHRVVTKEGGHLIQADHPDSVSFSITRGGKPIGGVMACRYGCPDPSRNAILVLQYHQPESRSVWQSEPFTVWRRGADYVLTGQMQFRKLWSNEPEGGC